MPRVLMPDPGPPPSGKRAAPPLLTIEQLADRWSTSVERVYKRLRETALNSINIGTQKHPDLRFRVESVELWERQVEQPARAWLARDGESPGGRAENNSIASVVEAVQDELDDLDDFRPRPRTRKS